jgi:AraC-like DNA-binding protein
MTQVLKQAPCAPHISLGSLAQCQRDLASPILAHRHVSEIAFAWGFNDVSHFGRVFRERYGLSPRDFRTSKLPK